VKVQAATRSPDTAEMRDTTMLIDEILRALRDPEYRAQLTGEVSAALPDRPFLVPEQTDSEQDTADA